MDAFSSYATIECLWLFFSFGNSSFFVSSKGGECFLCKVLFLENEMIRNYVEVLSLNNR